MSLEFNTSNNSKERRWHGVVNEKYYLKNDIIVLDMEVFESRLLAADVICKQILITDNTIFWSLVLVEFNDFGTVKPLK